MMFTGSIRALIALFVMFALSSGSVAAQTPRTERIYLSGQGPKDAVPWGFSVTSGRRAGEATTIPVPSNWEQHGFGTYSYGQQGAARSDEHGLYRLQFTPPAAIKGKRIRLVFEGVMTDATVKVNGVLAGPTHSGAFYRFNYDVTALLKPGEDNLIEVDVAKESANLRTNRAERQADYWVFGGIFRPVWLEVSPIEAIRHTAIDAKADGSLTADIQFDGSRQATRVEAQVMTLDGAAFGAPFSQTLPAGGAGRLRLSTRLEAPKLWTAETPELYNLHLTLYKGEEAIHTTSERFGFRTFEVRAGKGFYLNGQRILLKGVNRHSFRPKTARALDVQDSYDDVRLIKSMNMNAVRMSHYPPDPALLEAADELGLYVLNELSGWQNSHDTTNGRLLVREMVERDVNHPSILFWDNGNEGGWNRDLDGEFDLYDPQKRRVLHPWEVHDDVDTKHYSNFEDLTRRLAGPNLLMPTEVLHALYDGGAGAGLEDYWRAISASPFGGGAFIWVFADEGIMRTDRGGMIDNFSTFAPDGVVGPNHEKEGSYYTLRDLWSPVQIAQPDFGAGFDGTLTLDNHYDFTPLSKVRFQWRLVRFPGANAKGTTPITLARGALAGSPVAPQGRGTLKLDLPADWREAEALMLTATGPDGADIWTWTWPLSGPIAEPALPQVKTGAKPKIVTGPDDVRLSVAGVSVSFDPVTGLLRQVKRGAKTLAFSNGPRLAYAKPKAAKPSWLELDPKNLAATQYSLVTPQTANLIEIDLALEKTDSYAGFKLEITADNQNWKTVYDSTRRGSDGIRYSFAPQTVSAIRFSKPVRDSGAEIPVKAVRVGFEADRFPVQAVQPAQITTGTIRDPKSGREEVWLNAKGSGGLDQVRWTLRADGSLKLDYSYDLSGDYIYHGVTFDHAESRIKSVRSLGLGPYRVWQNRLRGVELGVREADTHLDAPKNLEAPEGVKYPEFQGYFAGLRWVRFNTDAGPFVATSASDDTFLRIGTPLLGHINTSPEYPTGDISFLKAIPAMGSKFVTPENTGPQSQPAKAAGTYSGTLVFTLPEK